MKIVVVIPTLGYGGAERLLVTLLPKLKAQGYEIKVCLLDKDYCYEGELDSFGIEVVNLNLTHRWSVFEAMMKLSKEVKGFKADILWGHLYFGILYSRLVSLFYSDIKVISHLHYKISTDSVKKGLWYSFRNWIFDKSQKLDFSTVAVSKSTQKDYEDFFNWRDIEVIYNVIDTKAIDKALKSRVESSYLYDFEDIVLIVGRLHESKGHRYLIDAIYRLKMEYALTPRVIVAGDGYLKEELLRKIRDLGVKEQFIFTGNLEQKELFSIMSLVDIVVVPSLFEAFGIVALEAMYLQRATITTKIDGLKEIMIDREDTIQVEPKSVDELKEALALLLRDKTLAKRLGENAKLKALEYDVAMSVNRWVELFEREIR
jgi:glycosyltransferase involved in cell wall biosynthesis